MPCAWPAAGSSAVITKAPAPAKTKQRSRSRPSPRGSCTPGACRSCPTAACWSPSGPGRMRIVGKDGRLSAPLEACRRSCARPGRPARRRAGPDFATIRLRLSLLRRAARRRQQRHQRGARQARRRGRRRPPRRREVIFRQEPASRQRPSFRLAPGLRARRQAVRDHSATATTARQGAEPRPTTSARSCASCADGTVPPDNPFVGKAGRPEIWSIGHRNVQGAALHPRTGKLWTVEHGARGGDEINDPEAARTTAGRSSPTAATTPAPRSAKARAKAGMEQPVYYWDPSIAPSGLAFYTGDLFPRMEGQPVRRRAGRQALHRLVLDGEKVVGEEGLLDGPRRAHPRRAPGPRRRHLAADRRHRRVLRVVPADREVVGRQVRSAGSMEPWRMAAT